MATSVRVFENNHCASSQHDSIIIAMIDIIMILVWGCGLIENKGHEKTTFIFS